MGVIIVLMIYFIRVWVVNCSGVLQTFYYFSIFRVSGRQKKMTKLLKILKIWNIFCPLYINISGPPSNIHFKYTLGWDVLSIIVVLHYNNLCYICTCTISIFVVFAQVAHFDEWKQGENPLSRLCHTCRTVKPLRSKHCRVCNRCVKVFDHHCPYIYNCVGYYNRLVTLMLLGISACCIHIHVYSSVKGCHPR